MAERTSLGTMPEHLALKISSPMRAALDDALARTRQERPFESITMADLVRSAIAHAFRTGHFAPRDVGDGGHAR